MKKPRSSAAGMADTGMVCHRSRAAMPARRSLSVRWPMGRFMGLAVDSVNGVGVQRLIRSQFAGGIQLKPANLPNAVMDLLQLDGTPRLRGVRIELTLCRLPTD
jgi:hypothetical protein